MPNARVSHGIVALIAFVLGGATIYFGIDETGGATIGFLGLGTASLLFAWTSDV